MSFSSVPRPAKELKGFAKVTLKPGETRRVTVPLDLRSLAYYDVAGKQWRAEAGTRRVAVTWVAAPPVVVVMWKWFSARRVVTPSSKIMPSSRHIRP